MLSVLHVEVFAQRKLVNIKGKQSKIQLYVAPNGDDQGDGTLGDPLRTVYEARERVRELLDQPTGPDIDVIVQPGFYRLDSTFYLTSIDCSPTRKVSWQCPLGKKATLSGGTQILGWQPTRAGIWRAPCKQTGFRQLYVNGERRIRARGLMPADLQPIFNHDTLRGFKSRLLTLTPRQMGRLELHFANGNSHSILPVKQIMQDSTGDKLILLDRHWYDLMQRKEGLQNGLPVRMEGSLALLDQPGEWYHDPAEGMLYYMPMPSEEMSAAEVTVPVLERIMHVQGDVNEPVENLKFTGFAFADARWSGADERPLLGVMANMMLAPNNLETVDSLYLGPRYAEYEEMPSHVLLEHCHNVTLFGCRFTRMGAQALKLGTGCKNTTVEYGLFEDVSGNGLQVGNVTREGHHPTYPEEILEVNQIKNCLFRRLGIDYEAATAILLAYTDGTKIELNEFSNLPYMAVCMGWGWGRTDSGGIGKQARIFKVPTPAANNVVRQNHIHHCMLKYGEGGTIYTMGAQPGSVIEQNMIYQNPQGAGIVLGPGSAHIRVGQNKGQTGLPEVPTIKADVRSADRLMTNVVVGQTLTP